MRQAQCKCANDTDRRAGVNQAAQWRDGPWWSRRCRLINGFGVSGGRRKCENVLAAIVDQGGGESMDLKQWPRWAGIPLLAGVAQTLVNAMKLFQ